MIINQTNNELVIIENVESQKIRMINTKEKGLSHSRNMAILNSKADICMISDDDEIFCEDYLNKIRKAYKNNPEYDVILFGIKGRKKFNNIEKDIKFIDSPKVQSVQISFRREKLIEKNILFDTKLGAGTENGSGEENKFILECLKKNLKIKYIPIEMVELIENSSSTWFTGYNDMYFEKKGKIIKYTYGKAFSTFYGLYFIVFKHAIYKGNISACNALINFYKGVFFGKNN